MKISKWCCCYLYVISGAQASQWLETAQGQLVADSQPQVTVEECAGSFAVASYASRLSGPGPGRVRFNSRGLQLHGSTIESPMLRILPYTISDTVASATPGELPYWSWRQTPQPASGSGPIYQLLWADPGSASLRAVQVSTTPLQWRPQWEVDYQIQTHPWLHSELIPQALADSPAAEWLLLPGDGRVPLRLFDSGSGVTRQWPFFAANASYAVLPLAADLDLDGKKERLYVLSVQGLLMQYHWTVGSGWQASVVADLQRTGWRFDGSLQRFSGRWRGPQGWQQGEVFVLLVRDADKYRLVVLRRPAASESVIMPADLADPPALQHAGWQQQLPGRPVSPAKVLGGILYLPLNTGAFCAGAPQYDQLLVAQLYHGASVGQDRLLMLATPALEPLRLQVSAGDFQLWSGSQLILPQLHRLTPACSHCTEVLRPEHLAGQQPFAWFLPEKVY